MLQAIVDNRNRALLGRYSNTTLKGPQSQISKQEASDIRPIGTIHTSPKHMAINLFLLTTLLFTAYFPSLTLAVLQSAFYTNTNSTSGPTDPQKNGKLLLRNGCANDIFFWFLDQTGVSPAMLVAPGIDSKPKLPIVEFSAPVGTYNFSIALTDQINFEEAAANLMTEYVLFKSDGGANAASNVSYGINRNFGIPSYRGDRNTVVSARPDRSGVCGSCPNATAYGDNRNHALGVCPQYCQISVMLCAP